MHETQIHEPGPEELAVRSLTDDAERAMLEYGRPVDEAMLPEGFEGTMDRALSPNGHVLTRTTSIDGTTSYDLASLWRSSSDRGSSNRRWVGGGNEVTTSTSSELEGDTEGRALDADGVSDTGLEIRRSFADVSRVPVDRYQGSRPRVGRHRRDESQAATFDTTSAPAQAGAEVATPPSDRQAPDAEKEFDYGATLERATGQIEGLAEDSTVKWKVDKKASNRRSVQAVLPDERPDYSDVSVEITVIDEPDTPRWYVVQMKSPSGAVRTVTWSKGRERALVRTPGSEEYRAANDRELNLAANATDPERARIARRAPEITPERYAQLTRTQRLANRIGRLLGAKNVTSFW